MKIELIDSPEKVMSNRNSKHNYFGWSTAARLKNGKIALGASGYRLQHICPFGKGVISFSEDDGKTFSMPAPIIDTVLDDRDVGLCPFGKSGLIVTSFNNTVAMQRVWALSQNPTDEKEALQKYVNAYLDAVLPEEEKRDLGSTFRVSFDNGKTFGKIYKAPISSPHGPIELKCGKILWVGREFDGDNDADATRRIAAYTLNPENGEFTFLSKIPEIDYGEPAMESEPSVIELADGKLICHIRLDQMQQGQVQINTLVQSESVDGGLTWSAPKEIIARKEGAPAQLFDLGNGVILSAYSHRQAPCAIHGIVSLDNCKTWSEPMNISMEFDTWDIGYPTTVALGNNEFLTFYYAHEDDKSPAEIFKQKWRIIYD